MKKNILFLLLSSFFCLIINAQQGTIIITEVFYDTPYNESTRPKCKYNTQGILECEIQPHHNGEFIELYNPTNQPVDIGGWSIHLRNVQEGNSYYTFPKGKPQETTIVPQGMLVLASRHINTPNFTLEQLFPEIRQTPDKRILYQNAFYLSNKGSEVWLHNNTGEKIDVVSYKGKNWSNNYWNLVATNKQHKYPIGKKWKSVQRHQALQHPKGHLSRSEDDFMVDNATPLQLPAEVTIPDISNWAKKELTTADAHSSSTSSAVGTIQGAFNVNPTGAATYTIPIQVPLGITGMQPNIAITYNSQSGNGIVGWGTTISGISAITRVPKSIYYDGTAKGIAYNSTDALMLDGQRLIPVVDGASITNGTVYNTENDPFTTITCKGDSFIVVTKDGMKYTYGSTEDSKQTYTVFKTIKATNTWYLNKVEDL